MVAGKENPAQWRGFLNVDRRSAHSASSASSSSSMAAFSSSLYAAAIAASSAHATSSSAHSTASAVASVAAALSSSPAKASDKAKNYASAAMMACFNFPVSINKSSHPCGAFTIPPKLQNAQKKAKSHSICRRFPTAF